MISKFYAVFDQATGAYMNPFPMLSDGQALRAFTDLANDKSTDIGRHPEHYMLFFLADFDSSDGKFCSSSVDPRFLAKAHELLAQDGDD